jgi:Zn-finger nucleic acid-binding protein
MVTALKCPKCLEPMRSIERNGVVIERCTECGGVFLDRGELEHLITAEQRYDAVHTPSAAPTQSGQRPPQRRDDDWDDDDDRYEYDSRTGKPRKKKRGFLSEIFDID